MPFSDTQNIDALIERARKQCGTRADHKARDKIDVLEALKASGVVKIKFNEAGTDTAVSHILHYKDGRQQQHPGALWVAPALQ